MVDEIKTTQSELNDIWERLNNLPFGQHSKKISLGGYDELNTEVADVYTKMNLELGKNLAQSLPDYERYEERIKDLQAQREALHQEYVQVGIAESGQELTPELKSRSQHLSQEKIALWKGSEGVVSSILDEAHSLVETNKKRFRWSTWASYALYTLGWGLSLASRLFSVDGPTVEG